MLRLFAGAREAAGTGRDELPGGTLGAVLRLVPAEGGEGRVGLPLPAAVGVPL